MYKNPDFTNMALGQAASTSRDQWLKDLKRETGKSFE